MNKNDFKKLCEERIIFMDGATGSILLKRGMPSGVCNEKWICDNPELLKELQKEYSLAGSDIILAPTFGANRHLLAEHGLADIVSDINKSLFKIAKEANPDKIIAGDISMTGLSVEPLGDASFEELIDIYKEQITALVDAGAELLVIETIINIVDARAAIIAAKEICDLPIIVTMSFNENGMTLYGTSPEAAAIIIQGLGADAMGINCSAGPDTMLETVKKFTKFSKIPVVVKPNAGLPVTDESGKAIYKMQPAEFGRHFETILELGVNIIGGCCGTSPEFIKVLKDSFSDRKAKEIEKSFTIKDLIATKQIGDLYNNIDKNDFTTIDVDNIKNDDIIDEINECQNDFIVIMGNDTAKLNSILRNYHGIACYKTSSSNLSDEIKNIIFKYGAIMI